MREKEVTGKYCGAVEKCFIAKVRRRLFVQANSNCIKNISKIFFY